MLFPMKIYFLAAIFFGFVCAAQAGERLDNGIQLPDTWPPKPATFSRDKPRTPPYLVKPPKVIPIDLGRQLFVDDFLIQSTTLKRVYHQPRWHEKSPVFKAEKPWEFHRARNIPFAAPFSGGVWHDPKDKLLKMWYMAGTGVFFGYATSTDGIHWKRPKLDVARYGENVLKVEPIQRDSSTVWLDLDETNPARRYKMFYYRAGLITRFSADGVRWSKPVVKHSTGDRTTVFYNPFRKVWVYSVRSGRRGIGRCRYYGETRDLTKKAFRSTLDLSRWTCADRLDRVKQVKYVDNLPDLYNLDATPYESLMLGLFTIHPKVKSGDRPKLNYVTLGYSRDGFHWHRPDRRPFLDNVNDNKASNYGNVQSAGGGCLVMGDKLYFYCSGRNSRKKKDDGSGGSTGLAILRRDGFASMNAGDKPGTLTTRLVTFKGRHLFVNFECAKGSLKAEILDAKGRVIEPFSLKNSIAFSKNSTLAELSWKSAKDLAKLRGKPVRFRFHLTNGKLYSFWVSATRNGASRGYVAAGGLGFTGNRDTVGHDAYRKAVTGRKR